MQILLLALLVAGLCFTLYSLGKRVIALIWAWSKPTPTRRVAGSFATIAIAARLVFLRVPSLPLTSAKGTTAKANPIALRNNWRPISANERGTVSDALPVAVPILPHPPLPAAAVTPDQTAVAGTANPAGTGTPNPNGTPGATGTAGATGRQNATGTLSGPRFGRDTRCHTGRR